MMSGSIARPLFPSSPLLSGLILSIGVAEDGNVGNAGGGVRGVFHIPIGSHKLGFHFV